jgi:hypothetical protein
MWDHYQKTFLRMQVVMAMAACVPVIATRSLIVGIGFWVPMQIGSLLGAVLAARMRKRAQLAMGAVRSRGVQG